MQITQLTSKLNFRSGHQQADLLTSLIYDYPTGTHTNPSTRHCSRRHFRSHYCSSSSRYFENTQSNVTSSRLRFTSEPLLKHQDWHLLSILCTRHSEKYCSRSEVDSAHLFLYCALRECCSRFIVLLFNFMTMGDPLQVTCFK